VDFYVFQVIPKKYIAVNYIEKPSLLWDFRQIEGVIVEIARELAQYKTAEPENAGSENEVTITDYKKTRTMILNTAVSDQQNTEINNIPEEIINDQLEAINIAIYNVQRLTKKTKYQTWLTYCIEKNIHIIAISETKLKQNNDYALTIHYTKFLHQIIFWL
ncbi:15469_t:CDS:2, partial [Gigaspora margarita]